MYHLRTIAAIVSWTMVTLLTTPTMVVGQSQPPPTVCQDEDAFHAFDFWVGQWDVYDNTNGKLAGHNRIESQEANCVLVEHWTSVSGGTGMSMNYYDAVTEQWRQVWVANGYAIDIVGGLDDAGAMVLVGEIHTYAQHQSSPFRGTWTPSHDGTVRQLFEQQDAQGVWQTWFDGRYARQE
jgi:hypothetical protein